MEEETNSQLKEKGESCLGRPEPERSKHNSHSTPLSCIVAALETCVCDLQEPFMPSVIREPQRDRPAEGRALREALGSGPGLLRAAWQQR